MSTERIRQNDPVRPSTTILDLVFVRLDIEIDQTKRPNTCILIKLDSRLARAAATAAAKSGMRPKKET